MKRLIPVRNVLSHEPEQYCEYMRTCACPTPEKKSKSLQHLKMLRFHIDIQSAGCSSSLGQWAPLACVALNAGWHCGPHLSCSAPVASWPLERM